MNDYFVWQACALKAASGAIQKEMLSVLRDKKMGAEDKLIAIKAMILEQSRVEMDYHKAMEKCK